MRTNLTQEFGAPLQPEFIRQQTEAVPFAPGQPEVGSEAFWAIIDPDHHGLTPEAALASSGLVTEKESLSEAEVDEGLAALTEELKNTAELEPIVNKDRGYHKLDWIKGKFNT